MFYLNVLLSSIITTYIHNSTCLMHFYDDLSNTVQVKDIPVIQSSKYLKDQHKKVFRKNHEKCVNFLLQFKNSSQLMAAIEQDVQYYLGRNDVLYKYNNRKYIVIINDSEQFKNFFGLTSLRNIQNILVIYAPLDSQHDRENSAKLWIGVGDNEKRNLKYDLFTHKYIGLEGNNDPILLDTWYASNFSFQYNHNLYPDKVTDQQGRIFSAICYNISPYAVCNSDPPMGNEHNIIVKYVKRFNMTLLLKVFDIMFDPMQAIFDAYADINGWDVSYGSIRYQDFEFIQTVAYTYVALVPLPRVKYGFFTLVEAFDWTVWVPIFILYIAMIGVVYVRRKLTCGSNIMQPLYISHLELYGAFINQPILLPTVTQNRRFYNYITMLMASACILLTTAYNSRLSSVMVSPIYENSIDSLRDLADSNMTLYFLDSGPQVTLSNDDREIYKKLSGKALWESNRQAFINAIISRGYAIALFRRLNGVFKEDFNILQFVHENLKLLTPELFTDYYYMLLDTNSMHTNEMSKIVMTASEAGLMNFWEDEALRMKNLQMFNARIKDFSQSHSDILNINHLQGVYAFWCCGMVSSAIIFLMERFLKLQQEIIIF